MQGRTPSYVSSPIEVGKRPFEVISIDPKPMPCEDKATGTDSILVVTDRFSGYTLAIPHRQDDGAHELAKLMTRHVYEVFGLPRVLLSDHDPKFASDLFRKVHERMGVDQRLGTPYHYRSSGGVEIRVKTLQDELNILTTSRGGRGRDWYELMRNDA